MAESKKKNIALIIFLGLITFGLYFVLRKSDKKKSMAREWADAIIFAVSHKEFISKSLTDWKTRLKPGGVFVDVKSVYYDAEVPTGISYWAL